MKTMPSITILTAALLIAFAANGQEPNPRVPGDRSFIQTNAWWNLYFAKENNPLQRENSSINAVKIVAIDQKRPSWIKIAFPRSREEHFSIFGPAAKAHGSDEIALETALAEWEKTISEWKVMWVNLDFVVHVTRVEPEGPANPDSAPLRRNR